MQPNVIFSQTSSHEAVTTLCEGLGNHKGVAIVSRHCFHRTAIMGVTDAEFTAAKDRVGTLTQDPGNEVKLKMYALFKQVTVGKCNAPKPGAFDFVGKAKWSAWNDLGDMTKDDARQKYVDVVDDLVANDPGAQASAPAAATASQSDTAGSSVGGYENLKVSVDRGVCTIMMNRPKKKNALNRETYEEIIKALDSSGKDDSVVFSVLTGAGDFYSGGNDLNNFMSITPDTMKQAAREGGELLQRFVAAFIDFPKPLVAAVNGPAVGIPVTSLALCDVVYATDRATFHTPFSSLGQSPEACSSYLFPQIMGQAKANEVLLFGRKLTAQEAYDRGLVTEVFPDATFQQEIEKKFNEFAKLPRQSLRLSKNLIRGAEREKLHQVNKEECELLEERWTSEECIQAIMDFFASKSKL
ncbi:enoyl-CoA delta isomerase 2-like isoform X2 [Patiria miniata]|uniref:Delta(3),Delta(2)-enoyl-CoA isomerase n=1 Tax=Patiria miniata TaxID=46514 RepID=A0A914BLW7_PATMI|nr:enoyl-CoA delta isomerase 2-like isoform X2 [Patiria miniata]